MDIYFSSSSWSSDDSFTASVTVDGGDVIDLINVSGDEIEALEGYWTTLYLDLSGYTAAQFSLSGYLDLGHDITVDNIRFEGAAVPIPGALFLDLENYLRLPCRSGSGLLTVSPVAYKVPQPVNTTGPHPGRRYHVQHLWRPAESQHLR
jgi:hypothetical protein